MNILILSKVRILGCKYQDLSHRELKCLFLAAVGMRSYEIASQLSIKKSTVDGYRKQILKNWML